MEWYEIFIFGFACFSAVLFAPKTISFILSLFTRYCRRDLLKPEQNDWAIVTGATDGIGLEYSKQLAMKGYNLLLISRTQSKLLNVRKEIVDSINVDVEIHQADFTRIDIYDDISDKIASLGGRISVLVNNVGTSSTIPYEYADNKDDNMNTNILICNTYSVVKMCEIVLRLMKQQKHGIVINISSAVAISPTPLFSTYSATKTFVSTLSSTLADEYREYGITIQNVIPNQVTTNLSKDIHISTIAVPAKSFVEYALKAVNRERETSAHPKHKFLYVIAAFVMWWLPECLISKMRMGVARGARETALKNINPGTNTI